MIIYVYCVLISTYTYYITVYFYVSPSIYLYSIFTDSAVSFRIFSATMSTTTIPFCTFGLWVLRNSSLNWMEVSLRVDGSRF